jgi:hypothetical protein
MTSLSYNIAVLLVATLFAYCKPAGPMLPIALASPTQTGTTVQRECKGCRFRHREGGGFRRGFESQIPKAWQGKLLVGLAGGLGANGNCKAGSGCFAWKDCLWTTYALLFNASTEDLWFATDHWFVSLPFPGVLKPGKDGWLRVPPGRSALFAAGPYPLGCTGQLGSKELRLYTGKTRTFVARLRWSARCTQCVPKGAVTPPIK